MRALTITLVAIGSTLACSADQQGTGGGTLPPPPAWQLVWHDEFDGTVLDTTRWVRETGGHGWGNNELEFYTDRVENARLENGFLVIEAREEPFGNQAYTSARLKTQGLGAWRYARVEARIQIPRGQGLWPAFWMLGDNISLVGWPACGEIDIMENIRLENGFLVIEAREEPFGNQAYTSARLKTQGLGAWRYARVEARIQIPRGQGLWPAFWMLGENISLVGWPACGEIDIMENIGREPGQVHGTVHGPNYSGANGIGGAYTLSTGAFADDYHVFAIEWQAGSIQWFVDSTLYRTVLPSDLPAPWVFDHPFFIILNVAVGGYWPGNPDSTTVFPQTMRVDYVRVYQK